MNQVEIELHCAYVWDCDQCGGENFCRAIEAEIPPDEREEMFRLFHNMEAYEPLPEQWQNFSMMTRPDGVTCAHCGATFKTTEPSPDEVDEP